MIVLNHYRLELMEVTTDHGIIGISCVIYGVLCRRQFDVSFSDAICVCGLVGFVARELMLFVINNLYIMIVQAITDAETELNACGHLRRSIIQADLYRRILRSRSTREV